MRQILVKYIYIHQIFDAQNFIVTIKACVYYFYKIIKSAFYLTKTAHFVLKIFKFLYLPLPLFFPFFVIADL